MKRRILFGCLSVLSSTLLCVAHVDAAVLGRFDQALTQYTQDQVLDAQEYKSLQSIAKQSLGSEDRSLASHFLSFARKHPGFIRMGYSYFRQTQKITLQFAFAPTYAEDMPIQGTYARDVLAQISQNDVLPETTNDSQRCGAAALLAAHYLLFGSFEQAFSKLGLNMQSLSYRSMHLAQENLYRMVNSDGKPGLVTQLRYTEYSDGRIDKPQLSGEIKEAATFLNMRIHPMLGPTKARLYERSQVIKGFWAMYPQAVFLVGVHLDSSNGQIRSPNESNLAQNHFVLVFKQNNRLWLHNTGVLDNGRGKALMQLNQSQANQLFYQTRGTVEALTR